MGWSKVNLLDLKELCIRRSSNHQKTEEISGRRAAPEVPYGATQVPCGATNVETKGVVPPRRLPVECKKDYQNPTTMNHFMPAQSDMNVRPRPNPIRLVTTQGEDQDGMPGTRLPIVRQPRVPTVPILPSSSPKI